MDEDFFGFLEDFGPPIRHRPVPPSSIERYRGRLPDQLLAYWAEQGWCGYADGLFWTVDPQEYEPVVHAWIGETPLMEQDVYHIIARSAFGELYFWGEETGYSLEVFAPGSFGIPMSSALAREDMDFEVQLFFGVLDRKTMDVENMFDQAVDKLGRLQHDEMYGFVPAVALGGTMTIDHLQKVKTIPHLVLLAQLAPLDIITHPSQVWT